MLAALHGMLPECSFFGTEAYIRAGATVTGTLKIDTDLQYGLLSRHERVDDLFERIVSLVPLKLFLAFGIAFVPISFG